jgi:hypothetical protein
MAKWNSWLPKWQDVLLAALILFIIGTFVVAVLQIRFLIQNGGLETQKVVTIPLDEMNKCHDKDGVIVVRDGKWNCIGKQP